MYDLSGGKNCYENKLSGLRHGGERDWIIRDGKRRSLIKHLSRDLNEVGDKGTLAMQIFGFRLFQKL